MRSDDTPAQLAFQGLGRRRIEAEFDARLVTTDTGGLLLREAAGATRLLERVAACFRDGRNPLLSEHTVLSMVAQRIYGLALGYGARDFKAFRYRTRSSWSRSRYVVGKTEYSEKGPNPRFVVTTLERVPPRYLYQGICCARGEMENGIKERHEDGLRSGLHLSGDKEPPPGAPPRLIL